MKFQFVTAIEYRQMYMLQIEAWHFRGRLYTGELLMNDELREVFIGSIRACYQSSCGYLYIHSHCSIHAYCVTLHVHIACLVVTLLFLFCSWVSKDHHASTRVKMYHFWQSCVVHCPSQWNRPFELPVGDKNGKKSEWRVAIVWCGKFSRSKQLHTNHPQCAEVKWRELPLHCQQLCWQWDFRKCSTHCRWVKVQLKEVSTMTIIDV